MASGTSPFAACVRAQATSTELVVFAPSVGQAVEIAWPMSNGRRIVPQGLRSFLRRHGEHWACFCSLIRDDSVSCQIVHTDRGQIMAFCHDVPSVCGFRLNLTQKFRTALLESDYAHLPTLSSGLLPSMGGYLAAFFLSAAIQEDAPYFDGYFGEHQMDYPGVEQLAGTMGPYVAGSSAFGAPRSLIDRALAAPAPNYQASRARRRERLDRESIQFAENRIRLNELFWASSGETSALRILQEGGGISAFQVQGFLEQCSHCSLHFLASALRRHILVCTHRIL